MVDVMAFAMDNPAPATVILVSGDRDFAYAVSVLRLRSYRVVVIAPANLHMSLKAQASVFIDWNHDILDIVESAEAPLPATTPPLGSQLSHARTASKGVEVTVSAPINNESKPGLLPLGALASTSANSFSSGNASLGIPDDANIGRPQSLGLTVDGLQRACGSQSSEAGITTSSTAIPPSDEFKFLLDLLTDYQHRGIRFPPWSSFAEAYNRHVLASDVHDVEMFEEYLARAVAADIGVTAVGQWINLQPYASPVPTGSAPSSKMVPGGDGPGIVTPSSLNPAEQHAHTTSSTSTVEHFSPLYQVLLQQCIKGVTHPLRSSIGEDLVNHDSQVYSRAGVTNFKRYIALAVEANIVTVGGGANDAWISLSALAPFHTLVEVLRHMGQDENQRHSRSAVALALTGRRPTLYQDTGYKGFKQYVSAAETTGLIEVGGSGELAWIALSPQL
ncbi:hypothetical protein HWV62_45535 [Athelia sp. TMB]|nr:hypothetical protein HWV62_45535 [Athelia sp. TMB]